MIFCQGVVSSIVVVGWTYRLAQRFGLRYWWSRVPQADQTFIEFLGKSEQTEEHRHWPNWFAKQNFGETVRKQPGLGFWSCARSVGHGLGDSLLLNFAVGFRAVVNTWLLTLPACLFWWFGWYDGWNNSFNKGYEQAPAGPLISLFGIAWFIAAMFYVPLAQARQAITGEWRAFYDFRLVWRIVRLRWISSVCMATLYTLVALPLSVLKTAPAFLPQRLPALADLSAPQALKYLDSYFFWCALVMVPAYLLLRLVAARIYASGILALVQTGNVKAAELSRIERETLARLDLMQVQPRRERHFFVRFVAWTGTRAGRFVSSTALVFIWFTFVAQIYITEFLEYHGGTGWLNQPLVQLPWFHYVPARLKNPFESIVSGVLFWSIALLIFWVLKRCCTAKR